MLKKDFRFEVFKHIRKNAHEKGIYIDCINGYEEHVHCLLSLGCEQTIAKCIQMIKGESSLWINQQNYLEKKFSWQPDYYAVSVGESELVRVRKYIHNQESHHQKQDFEQEFQELLTIEQFMRMRD